MSEDETPAKPAAPAIPLSKQQRMARQAAELRANLKRRKHKGRSLARGPDTPTRAGDDIEDA